MQLTSLTFLVMLNLSQNQLSRSIPQEKQLVLLKITHMMGTWNYVDFHCQLNVALMS